MKFRNEKTTILTDREIRTNRAFDNFIIYLTAAVVVCLLLSALFNNAWPGNDIPVPENASRVKDMLNVLMYVIPLSFAGVALGNACMVLVNCFYVLLVYGIPVLYSRIIRRGESHE